jgi:hypothetical protein
MCTTTTISNSFEADGEIVGYAECASFMIEQLQHLARLRMHAHRARSG